jgi:predicted GIY-YIG superfamily endonuclease
MTEPTAVYRFYDKQGALLYVGATRGPQARWRQHASKRAWWPDVARKTIRWYQAKDAALAAEKEAIRAECPRYNVMHLRPAGPIVDTLTELRAELRANRAILGARLKEARALAVESKASGVSERRIAELLQVDRMTVRKWLKQAA